MSFSTHRARVSDRRLSLPNYASRSLHRTHQGQDRLGARGMIYAIGFVNTVNGVVVEAQSFDVLAGSNWTIAASTLSQPPDGQRHRTSIERHKVSHLNMAPLCGVDFCQHPKLISVPTADPHALAFAAQQPRCAVNAH